MGQGRRGKETALRYLCELHELCVIKFEHCSGNLKFADILTKQILGPKHHEGSQPPVGFQHYPPPNSLHYQLLNCDNNAYTGIR